MYYMCAALFLCIIFFAVFDHVFYVFFLFIMLDLY